MNRSRAPAASAQPRQAEEDGVARGDVGDRNARLDPALGHVDIGGQRRAAERAEIERQDDVALGAERGGDPRRRLELDPVALVIIDR